MADELTPDQKHAAFVKAHGRLSDDHVELVTKVIADPSASIELRQMLWRTTKDAFDATGKPWTVAEPVEEAKP
jgi:hypothetical protein